MSFAKNFGLKIAASLFGLSIFGLAVAFSFNAVFGTPDSLKVALAKSGTYTIIADSIAANLANETYTSYIGDRATGGSGEPVKANTAAFNKAAKSIITPSIIQRNTEKVIDGSYAWLDGSMPTPTFRLDTNEIQQQVAANLGTAATGRVGKLPICTQAQLQQLDIHNIDPFTVPCRPPDINLTALRRQFEDNLSVNNDSPADKIITAEDVTNEAGQNVFAQAKRIPRIFQLGQRLPWIFGVVAIISAVIVVCFSSPRLRGVKSVSIMFLIMGVMLFAFIVIVAFVFRQIGANIAGASNEVGDTVLTVARALNDQVSSPLKIFAIVYVLLGITGLVLPRFVRNRPQPTLPQTSNSSDTPPTSPTTTESQL